MKMHTASRALFLLLVSGFGWALWNRDDFSAEALQHWAQSFGNAGPLVVIAAYALTTALFPPGAALAFVLASYGFMLPGVAAYSYVDEIRRETAVGRTGVLHTGLITIGVVTAMSFLPIFIKKLRAQNNLPTAIRTIEAVELKRRLETPMDLVVLDVRTADEYSGPLGHIAGAVNIALADLPGRLDELQPQRNRPIAVVCLSDKRSTQAIHLLHDAGFSNLVLLRGGMKEWNSARLPVAFSSAS